MGNMSSPNSLQINEEKARAGKRKQGKARESEGTPGKPIKRDAKRTWKQSKRKHGITRERRQKQGKPRARQRNIRIASPAGLAPLASVAGKQEQVRESKGKQETTRKSKGTPGKARNAKASKGIMQGEARETTGEINKQMQSREDKQGKAREKQQNDAKTMKNTQNTIQRLPVRPEGSQRLPKERPKGSQRLPKPSQTPPKSLPKSSPNH